MNRPLRRSLVFSALLHFLILAAALISLPIQPLPEAQEGTSFEVQFESAPKAPAQGPAAKKSPTPSAKPTQPTQPTPQKIAPNTAPPPPPPPAPAHQVAAATATPAKPIPTPPEPSVTPTPTPVQVQQPKQTQASQTSIPTPPEPVAAPPSQSTTSQPNKTKNTVNDSDSLEATLSKLRSTTKSDQAPTARANPESGGATADSGNPNSDDTSALTADQRGAIGDEVRRCWTRDAGAKGADQLRVMLEVTTDSTGIVRETHVIGDDVARMGGDPVFRAFAERAKRALLDAQCATLPLPQSMLGQNHSFSFRFSP